MAATASAARSGERTIRVTVRAPSSTSASPVEAAVAPPPSTVPAVTGPSQRSRTAATAPGRSVLSTCTIAPSSSSTVLAAPARRARSVADGARSRTVRLSGIVSDNPRQVASRPARKPGRPSEATRCASYCQSSPTAAYPARCRTGDKECATGSPRTPHLIAGRGSAGTLGLGLAVLPQLVLVAQELVVGGRELRLARAQVDGHVVVPVALAGVRRGLQRVIPGRLDRRRRETRVLVGVVRR